MAHKFFPRTAEELIQLMEKRWPEPVFDAKSEPEAIRWSAAQRAVVKQMRDEFNLATRAKDNPDSVFD